MGWERVWTLALVQFGAEAIELRILTGLGLAFLVLMIIEGLRACFGIRRPKLVSLPEPPVAHRSFTASVAKLPAARETTLPQLVRARTDLTRAIPKRSRTANRLKPVLPRIRRLHSGGP